MCMIGWVRDTDEKPFSGQGHAKEPYLGRLFEREQAHEHHGSGLEAESS